MNAIAVFLVGVLMIVQSGCGLIFSGTHQDIPVSVAPPGTEVTVYRWNGEELARMTSPGTLLVHRPVKGQRYVIRAAHNGYCPKYWIPEIHGTAGGTVDAAFLLLTLGLLGLVPVLIDSNTGGAFAITDPIAESLGAEGTCK